MSSGLVKLYDGAVTMGAYLLAIPFVLHPRGKVRLRERFGFWSSPDRMPPWWFHGASLGEVHSLEPLIRSLLDEGSEVLLTSTSPTGIEGIGELQGLERRLLPFDAMSFLHRSMPEDTPRVLVICESEVWPGLLRFAAERGIRVVWVNGRLSERTAAWLRRFPALLAGARRAVSVIAVQHERARATFLSLGFSPEQVKVLGCTKYDLPEVPRAAPAVRAQWGLATGETVVVLGSVRDGEGEKLYPAVASLCRSYPLLKVVVAPRHRERWERECALLKENGLEVARRSEGANLATGRVLLLDSFGELGDIYSIAMVAFVGGSLVPGIGGHNPAEPARCGVPVLMGPYRENAEELAQQLEERGGLVTVRTSEDFLSAVDRWLREPRLAVEAGERCREALASQRGAIERVCDVLREVRRAP